MLTKSDIELIASKCDQPLNDPELNDLHQKYNEGSPREDWPNYYRFLYKLGYRLSREMSGTSVKSILVELGCHYGAASLHFLRGGDGLVFSETVAHGIDVVERIKPIVSRDIRFNFFKGRTDNPDFHKLFFDNKIDVLLIDSDHSYKTTADEFRLWSPKVKPGGLILFDDIDAPEYADGCGKFFKELEGEKISLPHLHPENWGFGVFIKE